MQRGGGLLAYRQRDALGQAEQSTLRRNGRAALGSLAAPGRDSAVDSPRGPADKLKGDSNGYCAECFKEPEARQLRTDLDALARYNQKAYRRRGDSDSRLLGAEYNSRVQGEKVKKPRKPAVKCNCFTAGFCVINRLVRLSCRET